uniref:Uncharacterized protein n=1 Tax=Oryzias latipes TaxID=8090 RepID=A0A3B3H7L9_ORYLA
MPGKNHGLPAGGAQPIREHPPLPAANRETVGGIQSAVPGGAGEGLHSGPGCRFLRSSLLHHAVLLLRHEQVPLRQQERQVLLAVNHGKRDQGARDGRLHPKPHQPVCGLRGALHTCGHAQPELHRARVPQQLGHFVDRILLHNAYRSRRRWRAVSHVFRKLFDRIQISALSGVPGASRDLPLLRQHLQFLADTPGGGSLLHPQELQHADRPHAAQEQHLQVQGLHEADQPM